ncbi:MAG: 4-hydroxy-tetrahydrodipicolinate reductase [Pseudomonadota bacterium]
MKIGVVGAAGRMGRMLIRQVHETAGCTLAGAIDRAGAAELGQDVGDLAGIGALGVTLGSDAAALFKAAQVVIDFTIPAATVAHARLAAEQGCNLVVGTTGLTAEHQAELDRAAQTIALMQAPNMSAGVVLLTALAEQVARTLGVEYDIEVLEMHHRHKIDAPSGTALALGAAAAKGRAVDLAAASVRARDGHTGARPRGAIGFATLRGGDVVGDHSVIFAGEGERLELTHKAQSRVIYAAGAVRAARWTEGKPPGRYGMRDVLGL